MPRWRNVHRYVHCDSVAVPGATLPVSWCDGVAMVWYRSEQTRLRHVSDRSAGPQMKKDEAETFARPVRDVAILAEELVFRPCEPAAFKLFLRVWRRPGQSLQTYREWWQESFGPKLLQRLDDEGICRGYVQNHARPETSRGTVPAPICDCVDELACDDAVACGVAIREVLAANEAAAAGVLDVKAIWTAETLLYTL
ncbi:hypothetical protein OCH7691_03421 [Oceanibacterium hippocampi]|uniref:EthD domain-containing protein n=2 Tax=Oceanibacterium hippocampi TaxID=745714 RepID=A0A1Y5TYY7_9PROT|nr:hypothetical protein OCH7691_03421 [Oceanibacterium hippocampi]